MSANAFANLKNIFNNVKKSLRALRFNIILKENSDNFLKITLQKFAN